MPFSSAADFPAYLADLHALCRGSVAPHASAVDAEARFPHEAFAAFKQAGLLSCYVPTDLGGHGVSFPQLARMCEVMGEYCGSTAMVFAMHQIQVACILHHAMEAPRFRQVVADLVEKQLILASATTELGIGGDVRTSTCFVELDGDDFTLVKKAPVISYAEHADAILVTARKNRDAGPSDQVHVFVPVDQVELEPISGWDTLGFRGTCSLGFVLTARCKAENILPVPYAEIHAKSMHPFSHIVWASLWVGIAADAVKKARSTVRKQARRTPGQPPPSAMRLAEVDAQLTSLRAGVRYAASEYAERLEQYAGQPFPSDFAYTTRTSAVKVHTSTEIIDIVGQALRICGINGYRNDHKDSLGRHLRDVYGAALMVNNDRILLQSSTMQIVQKGE